MAAIILNTLEQTCHFAQTIAGRLCKYNKFAIFLRGPLGSGKTTIAACLARALPGGQHAQVSSPSFTICNYYPTSPQILHCDLYRCKYTYPDEIEEFLDNNSGIVIMEWAEYFPVQNFCKEYLDISLNMDKNVRSLTACGYGQKGRELSKLIEGLSA